MCPVLPVPPMLLLRTRSRSLSWWLMEIGCGGGIVSEALSCTGYCVHGIDISAGSVQVVREHAEQGSILAEQLHYSVGDAYKLPLDEDCCADAVVMSDVLEHLDDLPRALFEERHLLKPGGVLVFDTFNKS